MWLYAQNSRGVETLYWSVPMVVDLSCSSHPVLISIHNSNHAGMCKFRLCHNTWSTYSEGPAWQLIPSQLLLPMKFEQLMHQMYEECQHSCPSWGSAWASFPLLWKLMWSDSGPRWCWEVYNFPSAAPVFCLEAKEYGSTYCQNWIVLAHWCCDRVWTCRVWRDIC